MAYLRITGFSMFGLRWLFRRQVKKTVRTALYVEETKTKLTETVVTEVKTESAVAQEIISGKCHVIDGDTIAIGRQKIRLAGIDAPELHNPYGKQAKWALVELCKGQNITAKLTGETSYDRVVAKCFLDDGRDLAAEMVKLELALDIPHFPDADYKHLETPNARRKLRWRPRKRNK